MRTAGNRRVSRAGWCPSIRRGIVAPAGIDPRRTKAAPAPDNHLCAGPDRGVTTSCLRRSSGACGRPSVVNWIITTAGLENRGARTATPNDHLTSGPNRCMQMPGGWRARLRGWLPVIDRRIVARAGIGLSDKAVVSAPDNHLRAGPDGGEEFSRGGSLIGVGRRPAIWRWAITATGKWIAIH